MCTRTTWPATGAEATCQREARPDWRSPMRRRSTRRGQRTTTMTDRPGFLGYRRPDGRSGVRNYVLVVPTVVCASVVSERISAVAPDRIAVLPHLAGCGQL